MLPAQPNRSLMDGIRCLQILSTHTGPIGTRELARRLDIETTRAHRLLKTLAHMGMARQNRNSKYMPGPAMHVLAAQSLYSSGLIGDSTKPLLDLHRKVQLITAFGMLWERNVYYLYHLMPGMSAEEAVGRMRLQPVTRSAIGMVLLSKRSDHKIREFFQDVDEFEGYPEGIAAVINDLGRIRERGYGFIRVDSEQSRVSLGVMSPNNFYTAVAVAGSFGEDRIPELKAAIDDALMRIFPEAP